MIQSFADAETKRLWENGKSRRLPNDVCERAMMRLRQLHRAANLVDLTIPPSNRLEALKGDRKGQHSLRINQQWRICFVWTPSGPEEIAIVDYH